MFRTGGHVIWIGGGPPMVELSNLVTLNTCRFGTPWCTCLNLSSTFGGISELGNICNDRCGLPVWTECMPGSIQQQAIWPHLADGIAMSVDGIKGTPVTPKCARLAGFAGPWPVIQC